MNKSGKPARASRPSLALLLVPIAAAALHAQTTDADIVASGGTKFVVAFPDTTTNTFDVRYANNRYPDRCFLFMYSAVDNNVSIKGFGYSRPRVFLGGGRVTVIDLMASDIPDSAPICTVSCQASRRGVFTIDAEHPIIVYQYMVTKFGAEAWNAIPVEAWGTEYFASTVPGEIGEDISIPAEGIDVLLKKKMFPAEILIIAAYDSTSVWIVRNGMTIECETSNVMLDGGEAFQVQGYVDTLSAFGGDPPQPDLAGSRILSNRPIAVISGNTRAQVIEHGIEIGRNSFKNMMIESVPPVDLSGTQFVYMPTWDALHPTGSPFEDPSEMRKAEFVRVYGTRPGTTSGYYMQRGSIVNYNTAITRGHFEETRHVPNLARVHYTDQPAQAMMHSSAVVRLTSSSEIDLVYDCWGSYSVEMTPREQWVGFAPFYAPASPMGMEHRINLVTDTAHAADVYLKDGTRFAFDRGVIEGTDLVWGTMALAAGADYWVRGENGARFHGFVYGTLTRGGREELRSGVPGRKPEYEEYVGIAYGYPLAPSRLVQAPGDSLLIRTQRECDELRMSITDVNAEPIGLRSITLENAINARIASQSPIPITAALSATVTVVAVDRRRDAHASVVIMDRSGKTTRRPYDYRATILDISPSPIVRFASPDSGGYVIRTITAANLSGGTVILTGAGLADGRHGYRLLSSPGVPMFLDSGGSFNVLIAATLPDTNMSHTDTLVLITTCGAERVPLVTEPMPPCIRISDVDFGRVPIHSSLHREMLIRNDGGGHVTFNNPSGGPLFDWSSTNFTISAADSQKVAQAVLGPDQWIRVDVVFRADAPGSYRTTARFRANTRECRDTSIWTAIVDSTASAATTGVASSRLVFPNPTGDIATVEFAVEKPVRVVAALFALDGRRVLALDDRMLGPGPHRLSLDVSSLPAGTYYCRLDLGDETLVRPLVIVR